MWRSLYRSLRVRLAILLATAVVMTLAAAFTTSWSLGQANDLVERLASAQRRLETLSAISGRVSDYALVALKATEFANGARDSNVLGNLDNVRMRVRQGFQKYEAEVIEEVSRVADPAERALVAYRSRAIAQMLARFDVLDRQTLGAIDRADETSRDAVRAFLDVFAASFGPALSQAIEQERTATQNAQSAMDVLTSRMQGAAIFGVILALALAVILYRWLIRPLVRRISEVAQGTEAVARGQFDTRLNVSGGDELGLAMARFNRMAARLARREERLVADRRLLQQTVDERTRELREANMRLADIDLARRRFFTDVSHELRTPLTVILGESEVSLRGRASSEDLRGALEVIGVRAGRLHRRVEDLLRIARSESGQIELDLAVVAAGEVVEEACQDVAGIAGAAGVDLVVAPGPDLVVEGDREWLRQVVEGLVSNAIRHTPPGGTVRISAEADGGEALIRVADTGSGIAEADLPHVFERFYRGSGEHRDGKGFGIGLALAKWVVEQHSGTIAIESQTAPGAAGTKVTIRLPLRNARQHTVEAAQ